MSSRTIYDVRIAARLPREMPDLISTAASRIFISPSAYVRQALAEKLQRDGFSIPAADITSKQAA
ncbi:hypothetical protein [Methylobacterium sp. R2-1]|uniref:hypothetical protein n=1 Tax=Methylobacterium sp. R2-1 TaxID=2587064 RepID=UPI00160E7CBB|nr:hypothetical protein [Methylobacterium sp. R2-1]MBB2964328.1 hypothetical protein [Methylobacterium sp. R2-1]